MRVQEAGSWTAGFGGKSVLWGKTAAKSGSSNLFSHGSFFVPDNSWMQQSRLDYCNAFCKGLHTRTPWKLKLEQNAYSAHFHSRSITPALQDTH